mmetsp:Transcript_56483/g.126153  ORF Transcript_56483/g.126153 Transcript_56483/m.126153 type:complete len:215 (-) Transcript_56483:30-674(-)
MLYTWPVAASMYCCTPMAGFGALQRWHASRCAQLMLLQLKHRQLPSTPSTGTPPFAPIPLGYAAEGAPEFCAFAISCARASITSRGGLGVLQRKHASRCIQFTLAQLVQRQFPSTPSTGAAPGFGTSPPVVRSSTCRASSTSGGGFGAWHRLHCIRCTKLTLLQEVHFQLPSTPSLGARMPAPPVATMVPPIAPYCGPMGPCICPAMGLPRPSN